MALLKYTGNIDLSRNNILDILKIQGPDFYEGLSNNLEITTKDETGKESGSLVLRSGSGTTTGNVYLFAGSYTDLDKIKGITLTTDKISINHTSVGITANVFTRVVATDEFVENINSDGYSATSKTAYNLTSEGSTVLKNKGLEITAGPSTDYAENSGYYKLRVSDSEKSAEYIDNVNVRNLFSQTGGSFEIGKANEITEVTINSAKVSSKAGKSISLESPDISILAQNSKATSGKISISTPNDFSLNVDNANKTALLKIKDIEITNSSVVSGDITLGKEERATLNIPHELEINAEIFTLKQRNDANNPVLASLLSDGKRAASLNVENATVNTSLTSSVLTTLNGGVKVNKDRNDGTLDVGGASSSIQSSTITLGTSAESRSALNTYIEAQTSDIVNLVESVKTSLARTLGSNKVVEKFNSEGYSITTDTPFTFTGKSNNTVNVENGSLTVTGPGSYGLTLNNSTAKEVLRDLELSQSYNQTAGTFTIASNSSKATSVEVYSANTVLNSTKLDVSAGSDTYDYSLTVNDSASSLSVRDATFNNSVSIANALTLKNDSFDDSFAINVKGDTTLTAEKNFKVVGNEQPDAILSSTLNDSKRTTSLTVEGGTFKTKLASNMESFLDGTTKITGTTLTIDASTAELLSPKFKIGASNKEITSLNAYITGTNLTGATLSETLNTSITRSVANKTFEETIDSTGIALNSVKSYSLNAYTDFNIHAGGSSASYPLSISADTMTSKIKATYLEATDYATVKNHVDLGDIRIKYDSSSQSLIFGAV